MQNKNMLSHGKPPCLHRIMVFIGSVLSGTLTTFSCRYLFNLIGFAAGPYIISGILLASSVIQYLIFRHILYRIWEDDRILHNL